MVGGVLFTNQVPPVLPTWLSGHCPDFLRAKIGPKTVFIRLLPKTGTDLDFAKKGRFFGGAGTNFAQQYLPLDIARP